MEKKIKITPRSFQLRPEWWAKERAGHITTETLYHFLEPLRPDSVRNAIALEALSKKPLPKRKLSWNVVYTVGRIAKAIELYEKQHDCKVDTTLQFIPHPVIPLLGVTPDGLLGECAMVEVACDFVNSRLISRRVETYNRRNIDRTQLMLECTKREWCDLITIRWETTALDENNQPVSPPTITCKRVYRDQKASQKLLDKLTPHIQKIHQIIDDVRQRI